jgi:ComF family protein
MVVVAQLASAVAPVVDLIYPPRCPACGTAIANQDGLCGTCWGMLDVPPSIRTESAAVPVFAASYYNETSRKLVLAYKHGGRIALARLLAHLMAARMPLQITGKAPPLLVPVPLHRWRIWQRGFNQAALLARELSRLGKGDVLADGLRRSKRTPSLGGLGREGRDAALAGAIDLHPGRAARIAGRDVILIDDVFTSGATSRACMAALNTAQPASIAIACFARVEDGDRGPTLDLKT